MLTDRSVGFSLICHMAETEPGTSLFHRISIFWIHSLGKADADKH